MSTEKATCLYSKLINPEMFYVTENFYKKESTIGKEDTIKNNQESSDIDNDFERDSQ